MASIRTTRSVRRDEGTAQRDVVDQPTPFVGLYLAPAAALLFAWVVHFAIAGWTWNVAGRTVHVSGSDGYMTLAVMVFTGATIGLGVEAWRASKGRDEVWRLLLTASSLVMGLWLTVLVGNGPGRWSTTFYLIFAFVVSTAWVYPRLHVLRRDPREDNKDGGDDELIKSLGLSGYRHKGEPDVRYDAETGEPERIVVKIKHRFGGTRSALQHALENIVSAVDGPEGLSRVTATSSGKASESLMTIILKDPFVGRIPDPGPSHPGGSPTEWALIGKYDDGEDVLVWLCGGVDLDGNALDPTGYAFMGMSRAGKTVGENRLLLDQFITRRGTCLMYLNKAKGGQDAGPIIAGLEVAILTDDVSPYRQALDALKRMISYRATELGKYGIAAWSWEKCFNNPPTHTLDGTYRPMEPMPALGVHFGEADAILQDSGEDATFVASKALSVGIIPGWSMQRWSADNMPTSLRFNIGTSFCFGTGDDYSHHFALSEPTIKAGAHPENWRNRHPGQFYLETVGVPEERFPIPAKAIGDVDNESLWANMRILAEEWGPRMDKLDRGTANATRGWWDKFARETDRLRRELTPGTASTNTEPPPPDDPTPTPPQESPMTPPPPGKFVADVVDDDIDATRAELDRLEVRAEIAETSHANGQVIRGGLITPDEDDESGDRLFDEMDQVNLRRSLDEVDPTDPEDVRFGVPDEATSPEEAQLLFDEALRAALEVDEWRDPEDPTGNSVIVRTGQIMQLNKFRSRTWYTAMLREMSEGHRICPPGIVLEKVPGQQRYRISRIDD